MRENKLREGIWLMKMTNNPNLLDTQEIIKDYLVYVSLKTGVTLKADVCVFINDLKTKVNIPGEWDEELRGLKK
ncbi:hypothetical protein [Thermoactinomyces vulgaris]|jgi:hypothetical protein|uniref:hypothetical protein n=1 Tax=Thermoactinomyces vulgaris TaxID=2026 RepID=UPI003644A7BC